MKPIVTYPDVERVTVDLLALIVYPHEPTVTVGIGVPADWTPAEPDHLQVTCDGTPAMDHPVAVHSTVRIVAWSATPTRAKELANLALGLLLAHGGAEPIAAITPLTGMLPARDTATRAELASFTVRVTVRSVPATL